MRVNFRLSITVKINVALCLYGLVALLSLFIK